MCRKYTEEVCRGIEFEPTDDEFDQFEPFEVESINKVKKCKYFLISILT